MRGHEDRVARWRPRIIARAKERGLERERAKRAREAAR